ncbi:Hypothetical protein CINCED_3A025132 [Cinara cedri]|uniref:Uncharacterized protein n=1 Tax=Cinara cedri TaxID=506608 RepID=A0A5E4MWR5_9HEMI|nr:Hypothetical protein CINCED_3A025132 [Cinara cedri]
MTARFFPSARAALLSAVVLWLCAGRRGCRADGVAASTAIRVRDGGPGDVSARGVDGGPDEQSAAKGVDEFLASLTQMIGTVLSTDARYSSQLAAAAAQDDGQQSAVSGRPNNRPPVADYFETGRPPYLQQPQYGGRPYPPPGPSGFLGGVPPPYPGGLGQYPQQSGSVVQALTSIAQHDDLRCVPRLLCEVSSGARPSSSGYYRPGQYYQQQQSSVPFLSKDALITLLTVLNFVDDSPLLMFGRAALLGYNARGDPGSCHTAYPTCPRDPDQLINYLNNHNGGFFRFFNQQLPQFVPQYAQQQPTQPHRPPYYQPPPYPQRPPPNRYYSLQQQYAPGYQRPGQYFANRDQYTTRSDRSLPDDFYGLPKPRILSGSPAQYYDLPSVQDLALEVPTRPSMTFPSDDHHAGAANSVSQFAFPSFDNGGADRRPKNVKMVFPDRTGTGGLRAELDKYGNYKGAYYADGVIKFVDNNGADDGGGRPSKIKIPTQWSWPASSRPGKAASEFHVLGNRLPYDKRTDFKFPRTS